MADVVEVALAPNSRTYGSQRDVNAIIISERCPHGVPRVGVCSGHARWMCSIGYGHLCLPDPCEVCDA